MKSKRRILLSTLLLATSASNTAKYAVDKKKRKKANSQKIAFLFVYLLMAAYSGISAVGLAQAGLSAAIPITAATLVSSVSLIFTFFRTNGYLVNFKEYDILMSLPVEISTIVECKFLYMYTKMLYWPYVLSLPMLFVYGIYEKVPVYVYPIWIILIGIIPAIPMIIASALSMLFAKISVGFKFKKLLQVVLTFTFVMVCFFSRYIITAIFKTDKTEEILTNVTDKMDSIGNLYLPIKWFAEAITDTKISSILLLIGITFVVYGLFFKLVAQSYRKLNSSLEATAKGNGYKQKNNKKRSVVRSIAFKEFKRLTDSSVYLVNTCIGELLALILAIAALIIEPKQLIATITEGAPVTTTMLIPALPFVVHFVIGMIPTTCCSLSLEGKNMWIPESLPLRRIDLYKGKMLFNLYLTIPFAVLAILSLTISFKAGLVNIVLSLILTVILCIFATVLGMLCGIKYVKLDWDNEVEVIKQSAAVLIYVFPNMFLVTGLMVAAVILGKIMDAAMVLAASIVIFALLSGALYALIIKRTK